MSTPRLSPRLSTLLAFTLLAFAAAAPARANPQFAVEQFARQLQDQAGQLSAEIRGQFHHAPNYGHLVADSQRIYGLSAQLRALTRAHVNPGQLVGSVRQMERLVAELENHVQDANFQRRVAYRGYGPAVAPCDTHLAIRMLGGLARTLDNLDDAARDLGRAPCYDDDGSGGRGPRDDDYGNSGAFYRGRGF